MAGLATVLDGRNCVTGGFLSPAIKDSCQTSLARLLSALGVRYVGEEGAALLDEHYSGSLEKLMEASEEELL